MANRTANYAAFYVSEPFSESNLRANATPDFLYYNQLRAWKGADSSFPFVDAHEKTYNVRDNSSWETLKKRLHDRLNVSKNIILFLSNNTKNSQALREEIVRKSQIFGVQRECGNRLRIFGISYPNLGIIWKKLPHCMFHIRRV